MVWVYQEKLLEKHYITFFFQNQTSRQPVEDVMPWIRIRMFFDIKFTPFPSFVFLLFKVFVWKYTSLYIHSIIGKANIRLILYGLGFSYCTLYGCGRFEKTFYGWKIELIFIKRGNWIVVSLIERFIFGNISVLFLFWK